jgi:hypothetical protein
MFTTTSLLLLSCLDINGAAALANETTHLAEPKSMPIRTLDVYSYDYFSFSYGEITIQAGIEVGKAYDGDTSSLTDITGEPTPEAFFFFSAPSDASYTFATCGTTCVPHPFLATHLFFSHLLPAHHPPPACYQPSCLSVRASRFDSILRFAKIHDDWSLEILGSYDDTGDDKCSYTSQLGAGQYCTDCCNEAVTMPLQANDKMVVMVEGWEAEEGEGNHIGMDAGPFRLKVSLNEYCEDNSDETMVECDGDSAATACPCYWSG